MELRQFQYFVFLAEELHFGKAALRAGIAQPALSQQLRRIEDELGVRLFERTKRSVVLTEAGHVFLPEARATVAQAQQALRAVGLAAKNQSGRLNIGIVGSAMHGAALSLVQRFRERRPNVDVRIHFMAGDEHVAALQARSLDVAFARPVAAHAALGFDSFEVDRETLLAVLPSRHRLARNTVVDIAALAGEPFVLFERKRSTVLFDAIIATCSANGFSPNITMHGDEIHSIVALVAAGLGVSVVPESLRHAPVRHAVYRRLAPQTQTVELVLVWRKDEPSPLTHAFVEEAQRAVTAGRT